MSIVPGSIGGGGEDVLLTKSLVKRGEGGAAEGMRVRRGTGRLGVTTVQGAS